MTDRGDSRGASASGVPLNPSDAELAAAQAEVGDAYDEWADAQPQDGPPPAGHVDAGLWPESARGGGPNADEVRLRVRRATEGES